MAAAKGRTRQGYAMNPQVRRKVVQWLGAPAHDGVSHKDAARALAVSERRLRDYLTDEVKAEARALRGAVTEEMLRDVDRAMWARACAGNVSAARLIYARLAQGAQQAAGMAGVPTLAELEEELATLKEEAKDDGILDDVADVGAGPVG